MALELLFEDVTEIVAAQQMAIFIEVSGDPKPGNVTPGRPFAEMSFQDMVSAAISIEAPLLGVYRDFRADMARGSRGLWGRGLYESCKAACRKTNTLFGSLLLQIPIGLGACAAVRQGEVLREAQRILRSSTVEDSLYFVRAARESKVGGLNHPQISSDEEVREYDITRPRVEDTISRSGICLLDLLSMSASYDLIASELVDGFPLTRRCAALFSRLLDQTSDPLKASSLCFCTLLSEIPDSLVARKSGRQVAEEVRRRAERAMREEAYSQRWLREMDLLDRFLREKDLNPGALADITGAGILLFLLGEAPSG